MTGHAHGTRSRSRQIEAPAFGAFGDLPILYLRRFVLGEMESLGHAHLDLGAQHEALEIGGNGRCAAHRQPGQQPVCLHAQQHEYATCTTLCIQPRADLPVEFGQGEHVIAELGVRKCDGVLSADFDDFGLSQRFGHVDFRSEQGLMNNMRAQSKQSKPVHWLSGPATGIKLLF